jgi:hypothetical protein
MVHFQLYLIGHGKTNLSGIKIMSLIYFSLQIKFLGVLNIQLKTVKTF